MTKSKRELLSPSIFDHIALAGPDVTQLKPFVEEALGLELTKGGSHQGLGSANFLASLGGRSYLEVVGPDPELMEGTFLTRIFQKMPEASIVGFGVETTDAEAFYQMLSEDGIELTDIHYETRKSPSGAKLHYRTFAPIPPRPLRIVTPFFIDWMDCEHPGLTSTPGTELSSVIATSPQPEELRQWYEKLGLIVPVVSGLRNGLFVDLCSGDQHLFLQSLDSSLFEAVDYLSEKDAEQ